MDGQREEVPQDGEPVDGVRAWPACLLKAFQLSVAIPVGKMARPWFL